MNVPDLFLLRRDEAMDEKFGGVGSCDAPSKFTNSLCKCTARRYVCVWGGEQASNVVPVDHEVCMCVKGAEGGLSASVVNLSWDAIEKRKCNHNHNHSRSHNFKD